jgi:carbon storage regulator
MLVLSRKQDERVIISVGGVKLDILVVDIRGDKVRLGIQAPPEVIVHREEVWNQIFDSQRTHE